MTFAPIAIVGQGCALPGALDPQELWRLVRQGRVAISPAGDALQRLLPGVDRRRLAAEVASDRGGFVRGFDAVWDARGYQLPAAELGGLDPVFTYTLFAARQALTSAGIDVATAVHPRGAVVLGNLGYPTPALNELARATWMGAEAGGGKVDARNRFQSGLPAQLTARAVGFGAGGFSLDAACASSLYAIKLACDRLHDGVIDLALAGGVNHADALFLQLGFTALAALSRTGQSRPFHREADGLVPAHGAALLVLKRLADAERAGDTILGVIRGVGLSNDGRSRGLLVPSEEGQVRAMRAAYEVSGLSPADVSLVECHATGTAVGDATEVRSLGQVFGAAARGVPLGSLKSNLGHLITASGAAGLIKVLGGFAAGERPATVGADDPIAELDPARGGFRLLQEAEPWTCRGPRVAAVSSFGFGGNNAHLLVEEPAPRRTSSSASVAAPAPVAPAPRPAVAIVAQSVIAAAATEEGAFEEAWLAGRSALTEGQGTTPPFDLDLTGLRLPPTDARAALPQQLLLVRAVLRLSDLLATLPGERTALLVGMQCDAEGARPALRWRSDRAFAGPHTDEPLGAAAVIGCMPNIVANRLNQLLDLKAPSYTVSAEEASGTVALALAARELGVGAIDAAVVAAVDLCCEPVQRAAARAVLPADRAVPGDAAVVLVLKRLDDARRQGDRVLAVLDADDAGGLAPDLTLRLGADEGGLAATFGHAHAASGLLQVAAVAAACERRALPSRGAASPVPWLPGPTGRAAEVRIEALAGLSSTTRLRSGDAPLARRSPAAARLAVFGGSSREALAAALARGETAPPGPPPPFRAAIVASFDEELAARTARAAALLGQPGELPVAALADDGIHVGHGALDGEVALVFTGPAGAYPGMGRELALALPELVDGLHRRMPGLRDAAGWVYRHGPADRAIPLEKLWGASYLIQLHAELTRGLLAIRPQAAIGYCSGETNALFAMGAWSDLDGFRHAVDGSGMYQTELAGRLDEVRRAWRVPEGEPVGWSSLRVRAALGEVRAAVAEEPRVHLTIVNSPTDVIIAGDPAGCERVVARIGKQRARPTEYDFVMHCPEARGSAAAWRALHHRPTAPVPGVRFYTHATLASYAPTDDAVADALTGQAMNPVDFPGLVERAYADGVRVFVEHGPHAGCTRWIDEVLGARPHLAVSLDQFGRSSLLQATEATARLWAAGVPLDHSALASRLAPPRAAPLRAPLPGAATGLRSSIRVPAHLDPVQVLGREAPAPASAEAGEVMALAPALPPMGPQPVLSLPPPPEHAPMPTAPGFAPPPAPAAPASAPSLAAPTAAPASPMSLAPPAAPALPMPAGSPLAAWAVHHAQLGALHSAYLRHQGEAQAQFVRMLFGWQQARPALPATPVAAIAPPVAQPPAPPAPVAPPAPAHSNGTAHAPLMTSPGAPPIASVIAPVIARAPAPPVAPQPAPAEPAPVAARPVNGVARAPAAMPTPVGPSFSRAQLETLSSGQISSVFGPLFERQDGYFRQVRMPEPPLLLADRVLGIDGRPGEMGLGTIWTETDVRADSWYLHEGRMPAGILVESGQADLLLISWLGIDFHNRSERVYRLLGCELTAHGPLPRPGETLTYDIHVDGHAQQGDVRLFFFHYDCRVDGQLRVSVRHGQAGFFTDEELDNSAGILWSAEAATPTPSPRLDPPRALSRKRSFSSADLDAFAAGRARACFGEGFERADCHTRTPTIQGGDMRLLDEVTHFDPTGGPWGRGYLRARLALTPDSWFFKGHFKNDPCMPGTLMFEGSLQAMSIYLAAVGYTLDFDGCRFEPVAEMPVTLRCRGQAQPTSKEVVYEVFVDEIVGGPRPTLYADLLGTVDGLKAFHCRRMALALVPAYPLDAGRVPWTPPPSDRPVAVVEGFPFDHASLLACAWGSPAASFGPLYASLPPERRLPRLPSPPYHFMSRIAKVTGALGGMEVGSTVDAEYDVPDDAWYFGREGVMPFAVLLEVALQPCGWLSMYAGCGKDTPIDLAFRNLDGNGAVLREVRPDAVRLRVHAAISSISQAGGLVLIAFDLQVDDEVGPVARFQTGFGVFPPAALVQQAGLPTTEAERARLVEPGPAGSSELDLRPEPAAYFEAGPRMQRGPMRMLDRLTGLWPTGGAAGPGRVRAEKDVVAGDWFFKAHFFQDPVQPGSLGIEMMLQALQAWLVAHGPIEGLAHPRFEAVARDASFVWKYRGQVTPDRDKVIVDLDITSVVRDERGVIAIASGSLWVDGKRIYSATGLGMRVVEGASPPVVAGDDAAAGGGERGLALPGDLAHDIDLARARSLWREVAGLDEPWAGEDILFSLLSRFTGRVHVDPRARGRTGLYLANHQVAIETLLVAVALSALTGKVPVLPAKMEHRSSWVGQLLDLVLARPGVRDPHLLRFIDRQDPASLLALRGDLLEELRQGRSSFIHVEGTRSTSSRQRVVKLSGLFLDLAIEAGVDVIPVRLTGGLPVAGDTRLEFPLGYAAQECWVGAPLGADELASLPLAARKQRVLEAIHGLGATPERELPGHPQTELAARVKTLLASAPVGEPQAVIRVALAGLPSPSDETRALLAALTGVGPTSALAPWLQALAAWLRGGR